MGEVPITKEMRKYIRIVSKGDTHHIAQFVEINSRAWRVYVMKYRQANCMFVSWPVTYGRTFKTAGEAMDFCDQAGWRVQRGGVND